MCIILFITNSSYETYNFATLSISLKYLTTNGFSFFYYKFSIMWNGKFKFIHHKNEAREDINSEFVN